MDTLPDDALLRVLGYLYYDELVRARAVCRRWRDLCLHPDLWRHERYRSADGHHDFLRFVLRLVPSVTELMLSNIMESFGTLAVTTDCAAAELVLDLEKTGDASFAALAIRNQAALGRLRALSVFTLELEGVCGRGLLDLLAEVHRVEGLTELKLCLGFTLLGVDEGIYYHLEVMGISVPAEASAVVPSQLLPTPSLKKICFEMGRSDAQTLRAHWQFQLRSHAATLRQVELIGVDWPSGLPAALLNSMPHLEQLSCPVLDDMHLLECARLRELELYPGFASEQAAEASVVAAMTNARAFFANKATELVRLTLWLWEEFPGMAASLVAALASSRRAKLETLKISDDEGPHSSCLALKGLPSLKRVDVVGKARDHLGKIPLMLLEELSRHAVPAVTRLRGLVARRWRDAACVHEWLHRHRPLLKRVQLQNPQLHILARGKLCKQCDACAAPACHPPFVGMLGRNETIGVCGHPADGSCCPEKLHPYECSSAWFHLDTLGE